MRTGLCVFGCPVCINSCRRVHSLGGKSMDDAKNASSRPGLGQNPTLPAWPGDLFPLPQPPYL